MGLSAGHPEKQGLKLRSLGSEQRARAPLSGSSRKTRIETAWGGTSMTSEARLSAGHPEKQGLKQFRIADWAAPLFLSAGHPEKQGLKRQVDVRDHQCFLTLSGSSRKTRIETERVHRLWRRGVRQTLSGSSRKTRIETANRPRKCSRA